MWWLIKLNVRCNSHALESSRNKTCQAVFGNIWVSFSVWSRNFNLSVVRDNCVEFVFARRQWVLGVSNGFIHLNQASALEEANDAAFVAKLFRKLLANLCLCLKVIDRTPLYRFLSFALFIYACFRINNLAF